MDRGSIAVVTGAARWRWSRHRGAPGEAGGTVYVTDRESHGRRYTDLSGTVEDTAERVTARGGREIPPLTLALPMSMGRSNVK